MVKGLDSMIRRVLRYQNIGIFLFFILNLFLILFVFTDGFADNEMIFKVILLYTATVLVSISPLGEWFICLMIGARVIKRKDMKLKMIPLLEIVYNKAFANDSDMVKSIHLKIIYDDSANAYAIGRKTICITSGLLKLPDDCILGILAHEVGHIVHKDSEIQMMIGGANIFISVCLFIIKLVVLFVTFLISLFALESRNKIIAGITMFLGVITSVLIYLWSKICMLFLKASMRANEYYADEYAYQIGFGYALAKALDRISNDTIVENSFLKALNETHPNVHDRIARLQDFGVDYIATF